MRNTLKWLGMFGLAVLGIALLGIPQPAQAATPKLHLDLMIMGATLGANVHTLADLAKRLGPDNKISTIIELLSLSNEILEDAIWKEGNLPTGERTTIRTGLPTVAWRLLNQGVQPSKSTTAQVDVQCGKLEAWCEIDEALAELNGNTNEYRLSEATAFIEAMNKEFAETLIYGNAATAQEEFTGLAPQYSLLSANNGQNIINAGGVQSDNTSIWLIGWGSTTVHCLYPQGSSAGLQHVNFGKQVAETTAGLGGTRLVVYRDQWKWDCGLIVRDWRYAVRIANIDVSTLIGDAAGATVKLIEYMGKAIHRIPSRGNVRLAFYANRTVQSMLTLQALNKSTNALSLQQAMSQFGHNISEMRFLGIPIRTCDSILETEAQVT